MSDIVKAEDCAIACPMRKSLEAEIERLREELKTVSELNKIHLEDSNSLARRCDELEAALTCCRSTLRRMQYNAFKIGLVGTSDWDNVAGEADLFGAIDKADAALNKEQS